MGWIAEFLSAAVLTGFIFGVAINVVSGELFKLTGTEKSGSNTWQKLWDWAASLPDANRTTVVLGIAALVVLFGLKFLVPKVPAELVAVVLGIAVTVIFGLGDRGGGADRGRPPAGCRRRRFPISNSCSTTGKR